MNRVFALGAIVGALILGGAAMAAERTAKLAVDNMYCAACPYIVKQSLSKVTGVEQVIVSFDTKTAMVVYDDQKASVEDFTSATKQAGYPSKIIP